MKAQILKSLFAHANLGLGDPLKAWPLHGPDGRMLQNVPLFGTAVYNAEARAQDAGTNLENLRAAGLALQNETHGRYADNRDPSTAQSRRANYQKAHLVQVDARVTPTNNPSGLRPAVVPTATTAAQMVAWHASLALAVANTPDDEEVVIPPLGGVGVAVPQGTGSVRIGPPGAPKAFVALLKLLAQAKDNIAGAKDALAKCEMPDDEQVAGVRDALSTVMDFWPDASKIPQAAFDTSQIRLGSHVKMYDGAPSAKLVEFLFKSLMRETGIPPLRVVSFVDNGASVRCVPLDKSDAWTLPNGKAVIVPVTAVYRETVKVAAKVTGVVPNSEARYSNGEVVFVTAINGDNVAFFNADGEELTGKLSDFKPMDSAMADAPSA